MNIIDSNPKTNLLLGAGLDVLHFESQEWLDTLDFWKDELIFFENLLIKKVAKDKSKQEFAVMLKSLDKIHKDFYNDFEDAIIAHEKLLSSLEKGKKGLSDHMYREKHQQLLKRMETFKSDFKQFKKIVFDYMKTIVK